MKVSDLRSQPDVAREIGFLIMFVSNLEILFIPMLAALLGGDSAVAEIIAVNVDNLSAELSILFKVAEQKPDDPLALAILGARTDVLSAVSFRNTLAHSLYVFDQKTNAFELFSNLLTERRGKPKCVPLTAELVRGHSAALENAILKVITIGGDRLHNPLEAPAQGA